MARVRLRFRPLPGWAHQARARARVLGEATRHAADAIGGAGARVPAPPQRALAHVEQRPAVLPDLRVQLRVDGGDGAVARAEAQPEARVQEEGAALALAIQLDVSSALNFTH